MSPKRYSFAMIGLLLLLIAMLFGAGIGGNILLKKEARKLKDLKIEYRAIETQQTALVQAKKDVERYSELEQLTKSIVPQDKDQAKTVREIVQIASANDIPVKSVSFPTSNLGEVKPSAPAGDSSSPTPAAPAVPPITQVTPLAGITGVFTLELQVISNGNVNYNNFLQFLEALEKNRRTAHVKSINLKPDPSGRSLEFQLTLNSYLKP